MAESDRLREDAARWLRYYGDLDSHPVIVPFGDPNGDELRARLDLARTLRDELFEPARIGPMYVASSELPLRGRLQHWGGPDIWGCDDHADWDGYEFGESFEAWREEGVSHLAMTPEEAQTEWETRSAEAHAAAHGLDLASVQST